MYKKMIIPAVAALTALSFTSCDVDKKKDGKLPSVDVDVEAEKGEMPEYEVETADVEVGTKKKTIEVPDVNVEMPEDKDEAPE